MTELKEMSKDLPNSQNELNELMKNLYSLEESINESFLSAESSSLLYDELNERSTKFGQWLNKAESKLVEINSETDSDRKLSSLKVIFEHRKFF